jgi:hypothetical protein
LVDSSFADERPANSVARIFKGMADDSPSPWGAVTHNAALDSALISLRCFNEFFSSDRKKDDIRAGDFPGVSMQPFLPPDDETATPTGEACSTQ